MPLTSSNNTQNSLLDALSAEAFGHILPCLEPVPLPVRLVLHGAGEVIEFVYFPQSGMVSVVAATGDAALVEVGIIGREGFVGIPALLESDAAPHQVFMQVAGSGYRMTATAMRSEMERSPAFRRLLLRYAQSFLTQVAQLAACNARHPLDARLARWLLMAGDRLGPGEMPLTQEFLAMMLGVQRPGVNIAARMLQKGGSIRYTHGRIEVVDPAALEAASCECRRVIKRELDRLLPPI
jgi:CRP-like cAMP-binding protein